MVQKIKIYGRRTFASLSIYNYRLYVTGQIVSQLGTWTYMVAQTWLVLQLTQSAAMVGMLTAAQFLPVLLLGVYGGVITDRYHKRKLIYVTQSLLLLMALTMAILMFAGVLQVWMIFALAAFGGLVAIVDNPARQAFVTEMVGPEHVQNAISLNSIVNNSARVVGPAVAAAMIANLGMEVCFLLNAFTFLATLICLKMMRMPETAIIKPAERSRGQLMAGLRYVRRTPVLRTILIMMATMGIFSFNFPVILPVLADSVFHSGASGYALLSSLLSLGAVIGGFYVASRKKMPAETLAVACLVFGGGMLLASALPTLYSVAAVLMIVGFASTAFVSLANSTLQLRCKESMRGRVLSLWMVAVLGTAPIGGVIIGFLVQHAGPRAGLVVGAGAAFMAGMYGLTQLRKSRAAKPAMNAAA